MRTDTIFGAEAKNVNIYEEHAKAVVLSAVAGFNGVLSNLILNRCGQLRDFYEAFCLIPYKEFIHFNNL